MTDRLRTLSHHPLTAPLVKLLGLPQPPILARAAGAFDERPFSGRTAMLAEVDGGYAGADLRQALTGAGATLAAQDASPALDILVLDATGCTSIASCRSVYELMHARVGLLAKNARADRGGGALGRRQPGSGRRDGGLYPFAGQGNRQARRHRQPGAGGARRMRPARLDRALPVRAPQRLYQRTGAAGQRGRRIA
ncbi:hypothetical protein LP420_40090 [Massilia sp. B-10]|nr:hypothetical protein LP420_40090 [Massilia sp. B-10]